MNQVYKTYLILAVILLLGGGTFLFFTYGGALGGTRINVSVTTTDLSRGLVGHWTFDGPDLINNVVDKSGTGNTGYLTNFTSTTTRSGKVGQALEFDGVNNRVDINAVEVDPPCAMSAWVMLTSRSSGSGAPIHNSTGNPSFRAEQFSSDAVGITTSLADHIYSPAYVIPLATWVHLLTNIESDSQATLYVNGKLSGTVTGATGLVCWRRHIGNSGNFADKLPGRLDDVRIYNRALSATEISRLYELGATTKINTSVNTTDLSRGLVGHWTFDGPDLLQNAVDKSGTGNTGYLLNFTSTTTVRGKIGQGLQFDGTNDSIGLPDNGSLETTQGTVVAWIKPTNDGDTTVFGASVGSEAQTWWTLGVGTGVTGACTNELIAVMVNNTDKLCYITTKRSELFDGSWHQIVVTVSSETRIYLDGVSKPITVGSGADNGRFIGFVAPDTLRIGSIVISGSACCHFAGGIDDVRVYNRALSATEVSRLYELGATTKINTSVNTTDLSTGLVGHWTFDGPDLLQNAVDKSGQGNTGYLTNFTSTTTVRGKIGQALQFDGSNDYVTLPTFSFINATAGTLSAWSVLAASPAGGGTDTMIFSHQNGDDRLYMYVDGDVATNNYTIGLGASSNIDTNISSDPYLKKWIHTVLTYNSGDYNFFVDGILRNQGTYSGSPGTSGSSFIGHSSTCCGADWNGLLDDVRIYNRALSAEEVSRLYKLGR